MLADQDFITFTGIARKACFVALALTGLTGIIGLVAAVATQGSQCPAGELMHGYRPADLVGLTLPAGVGALMCLFFGWCTGPKREEIRQFFKDYDWSAIKLASIEISFAGFFGYAWLASAVGLSGLFMVMAVTHCIEVLTNCQLLTTPH